ncbi:MAG: DUF389 domain-containing protein [Chitinophagales bacterium]|nr:DUF389 domain-containing protein [Chitinophagales bacterium]
MSINPIKSILKSYFDLRIDQLNETLIVSNIKQASEFKGTNLWALIAAILIASVGLNMNSTAVIIGAMLISPLMGPIIGIGYALATFNLEMFKQAAKNFLTFVIISVVTASIYFWISPFKEMGSEITGRTFPTAYDVLIAFFGGVAGIVAFTRKEKSNIIPGVAIATALMPPLCVAGFGIANFNFSCFAGATYLFIINCVMIAFATFMVSKVIFRVPNFVYAEGISKKRINTIFYLIILLTIIPSIYMGYTLVQKTKFTENTKNYVADEIENKNIPVLKYNSSYTKNEIEVFTLSDIDSNVQKIIIENSEFYGLKNPSIKFKSAKEYIAQSSEKETADQQKIVALQDSLVAYQNLQAAIHNQNQEEKDILTELHAIEPKVKAFGIIDMNFVDASKTHIPLFIVTDDMIPKEMESSIRRYLVTKFPNDSISINYKLIKNY